MAHSLVSITQGGSSKLASAALCLAFDSTHSHLWVGDSKVSGCGSEYVYTSKPDPPMQGSVYNFSLDSVSGKLQRLKR